MRAVRVLSYQVGLNPGEVGHFPDEEAARLVRGRLARYVDEVHAVPPPGAIVTPESPPEPKAAAQPPAEEPKAGMFGKRSRK
jgi:hypothetical protein